jgi:hypothetical protein
MIAVKFWSYLERQRTAELNFSFLKKGRYLKKFVKPCSKECSSLSYSILRKTMAAKFPISIAFLRIIFPAYIFLIFFYSYFIFYLYLT